VSERLSGASLPAARLNHDIHEKEILILCIIYKGKVHKEEAGDLEYY